MATGDQADFVGRLQTALPLRWFPSGAPVLNGVLSGLAAAWTVIWQNLQFLILQTRINTATGEWLDAISVDFFAGQTSRYIGEADAAFRRRIIAQLLRARGTRAALISTLTTLTGATPQVFEFTNIRDTGAWGAQAVAASFYYGAPGAAVAAQSGGGGGWGNINRVFQATAMIPQNQIGPGLLVSEICVSVADVAPCCGIIWLNAFDSGGESYLSSAEFVAGAWVNDNWTP